MFVASMVVTPEGDRDLIVNVPWIPKNSLQSWIALVIKKLSKHQNLTQFN